MKPPEIRISDKELQGKFNRNEGGYPAKINSLVRKAVYCQPAKPSSGQKSGCMSIVYKYWEGNVPVMCLHCFVNADETLGASGKMDPKRLLIDGISYFCD